MGAYEYQGPFYGSVTVCNSEGNRIGTYSTIQKGINVCPNGGTVIAADGIYAGSGNKHLNWSRKHITVRSINGPDNCIVDCQNSGRGFSFDNTGQNSSDVIEGFTIRNGNGYSGGGGIYCYSSSPSITDCVLSGNTTSRGGGIFCDYYSSPTITNCVISGNNATDNGGGIFCESSSPIILNCVLSGNTATNHGGGIYCYSSSPSITDCVLSGNTTSRGGGIFCGYSSPTITNCVISGNNNYGIYEYDTNSDPPTNYNCFYNNSSGDYYDEGSTPKTVAWLNTIYNGNISAEPRFIGGSDYHLQPTSPCIDAGLNTAPDIPATDKDGNPRIVNGIVDIGAYEFQGPPTITTTSLPNGVQNTAYSQTLSATGGLPPYTWTIADGSLPPGLTLSTGGLISGIPTEGGTFTFIAQVQDSSTPQQTDTQALSITIIPQLNITTTSLPNGVQNVVYSQTLSATGGVTPYTWSLASGNLPSGLTLNATTGVISGIPTYCRHIQLHSPGSRLWPTPADRYSSSIDYYQFST